MLKLFKIRFDTILKIFNIILNIMYKDMILLFEYL